MNIGLLLEEHAVLSRERGTRCQGVQHVSRHEADTPNICSRWVMFITYLSSAFYIYFFVYSNMYIRLLKYAYEFLTQHSIYFYKLYLRAPRKFSYTKQINKHWECKVATRSQKRRSFASKARLLRSYIIIIASRPRKGKSNVERFVRAAYPR